ncbi:MAG: hypothetical protein NTV61_11500 [Candidatus Bathyarchaeota archaeon]|nr:hypothetical protein [Candidatus Bathyarchaeota archaeon]
MSETIHPKISAIQNHLNLTNALFRAGKYQEGVFEMRLTLLEIAPKDRDPEIVKELDRELSIFSKQYPSANRQRVLQRRKRYIQIAEAISDLLWTRKYFDNNRYGESRDLKDLREAAGDAEESDEEEAASEG